MKSAWAVALGLVAALAVAVSLQAADKGDKGDKGEKTLKGTLVCGKCALKETDECTNVLQVKEGEKTVNYYLDDSGKGEDYHKAICTAGKAGKPFTVTGTVSEKDGKMYIKASKVTPGSSSKDDKGSKDK
jgi:hypothetical protein